MKNIKEILRRRGMTQLQLTVAAKISPYRLSRLFNKRAPLRYSPTPCQTRPS